jgi:aspartyl-tRNA(Asn)/glutamyl-tRNA(Gln) amidotransferase subunit A
LRFRPEPEIVEAVEAAAHLFEEGGAIVEPVEPFMTPAMLDGLDRFWRTRFWEETRYLPPDRYGLILEYIRQWVEPAAGYDGASVYTGFDQIIKMRERGRAYNDYDLLLSPVSPCLPLRRNCHRPPMIRRARLNISALPCRST